MAIMVDGDMAMAGGGTGTVGGIRMLRWGTVLKHESRNESFGSFFGPSPNGNPNKIQGRTFLC